MGAELKFKTISQISVKEEEGGMVTIEGWGAVYNNIDSYNDILMPGCAKKTLEERKARIKLCNQHDIRQPIGKFEILEERMQDGKEGIWFKALISKSESAISTKIKEGILNEFSIGYREVEASIGERDGKEVNLVKEIKLYEISVVTVAANEQAVLTSVKSEEEIISDIEKSFDQLIKSEKNEEKSYELLKLKKQTLEAIRPEVATPPIEPEPFTAKDARSILLSNN